jgi:DNA-binding response OmpR family regulator
MSARILLAEDEPSIVVSLEFLLRQAQYEVSVARDGNEALSMVESFKPDLVLLDVMMPARSGFEVCARIRENPEWKDIKILMLTARGRTTDADEGLACGANAYVTKPFSTKELVAQVRTLLGDPG